MAWVQNRSMMACLINLVNEYDKQVRIIIIYDENTIVIFLRGDILYYNYYFNISFLIEMVRAIYIEDLRNVMMPTFSSTS